MSMDGVGVRVAVGVRDVVCEGVPVPVPVPDDDAPRDSVAVDDAVAEAVTVGDADGGLKAHLAHFASGIIRIGDGDDARLRQL